MRRNARSKGAVPVLPTAAVFFVMSFVAHPSRVLHSHGPEEFRMARRGLPPGPHYCLIDKPSRNVVGYLSLSQGS
eukprot:16436032-Heterocapsa_arctica.AAC.1